jgi:hypothetical protein
MSEVGALIVKLTAETAQFREDMGRVKSDLDDLKGSAGKAGEGIESSMQEARGGLMLVEDAVGVRLPRHLNSLIAQIPGVGAAFAMMLPIAGVAVAIKIISELIEKHHKLAEEAEQSGNAQKNLAGTIGSVYSGLRDKLLQAGIAADELSGNHLAAVKKELELIDHQSLNELAQSFETLAGAAEKSLSLIKAGMFEVGSGGEGAKASLARFQAQYEMLLKTGKGDEANKLLNDKITREEAILKLQEAAASKEGTGVEQMQRRVDAVKALVDLTGKTVDFDDKSIESEKELLDILQAESNARETILQTAGVKKNTASQKGALQDLAEEAELQKIVAAGVEQHSQALIKLARTQAESTMASTKGGEDDNISDKLAKQKAAIEEQKEDSIAAAQAELVAKASVYEADMKAAGANAAKKKELNAQWANEVHAYADQVIQFNADADKQIVAADRDAANQRAAIQKALQQATADDALKAAITQAERTKKIADEAAKNEAALHKATDAQTLQAEIAANQAEVNAEVKAYQTRLQNLDKFDKDYEKKVKELNDKIAELTRKGQDDNTTLIQAAQQKQLMDIQQSENKMKEAIADDVAHSIVMNKSLAASFRQTGEQMAEQMIKNLIMMELTGNKEKLIHAKNAYGKAFDAMSGIPPAPMWGYAAGAAAFAAVMSFEEGGKIPGASVGSAGAVPIIGHQGETVVTKALTDRVEAAERGGNNGSSGQHNWNFSPTVHAMDAEGVDRVLARHNSIFQRHVAATMRRMNR